MQTAELQPLHRKLLGKPSLDWPRGSVPRPSTGRWPAPLRGWRTLLGMAHPRDVRTIAPFTSLRDLGADLLGMVVESITGEGLDSYLKWRVFDPLGMNDTGFRPADSVVTRVAPTEVSPPRGYPIKGEVHDENAFALGGVAGHAGLFGTASDLAVFAQMLLDGGTYNGVHIVADSTIKQFTARAAGSRALGWEVGEGQHGSGNFLRDGAFGHTGFTGTSLWIDPDRELIVVLLTNRIHPSRANERFVPVRARVHEHWLRLAGALESWRELSTLGVSSADAALRAIEQAFRAGQLDITMDVPRTKLDTYEREHPGELHRVALALLGLAFRARGVEQGLGLARRAPARG